MGNLDDEFMGSLVRARELVPKIQKRLDEPGYLPECLDCPADQDEVDATFAFGTELATLTGQLNSLAVKLCVGMQVQEALDSDEKEEDGKGMDLWEQHRERGVKPSDF